MTQVPLQLMEESTHMNDFRIVRGRDVEPEMVLNMVKDMIEIDKLVYREEFQGTQEVSLSWADKNPDIYTYMLDDTTGKVVGYINAMPIKEELADKIVKGESFDTDISASDILTFEDDTTYTLYFCSIAVHPEYRGTTAFTALYNAFIMHLIHLTERGIYITKLLADGVTAKGARMCRLSGLDKLLDTSYGSEIYLLPVIPEKFRALSYQGEKLREIYMGRFGK